MTENPQVPALGAVLIKDDKVEGSAVRGMRRNDRPDPVQPSDVWIIGSDAKAMTATMVARLVDRGLLRWNERLDEMLPEIARAGRPEYRGVTLVQLLSHRAGLAHDLADEKQFGLIGQSHQTTREQRLAYLRLALKDPPISRPGSAFSYSNTGYLVAAAAAERATGRSYERLMREELFGPLGMGSAGFGALPPGQPSGHSHGHPATAADLNPLFFAPAGNIYLSLSDWAKFCIDQLAGARGHGRVLRPQTYRFVQTSQGDSGYGLGWGILASVVGRAGPALAHSGSDGNWFAEVVLFPRFRSGVLVVSNAGEDMGGDKADSVVIKAVLPDLVPPASPAKQ
ncbi:MAG TPA: serine hydrolase domain-containing protein [Sphingomicrobium sp.]|nr:serine hydrolase domain-containing protein [Sphingomicrobium sp.]